MLSLLAARCAVIVRPLGGHHGRFADALDNPLFRLLSQPFFWAALGMVVGPCLFYRGFQMFRLRRLVMDTPRSAIEAAALGNVEILGAVCGPYVLVAPLSKKDCFYYRIIAWVRHDGQRRRFVEERFAPLFLDDGTDRILIDPRRARLNFESSAAADGGDGLAQVLQRHGYLPEDVEEVREFCISPGMKLFAFGKLAENPWISTKSKPGEEAAAGKIGPFMSEAEAQMQRRESLPPLDPMPPSGALLDVADRFDAYPPAVLMKGKAPFVLSSISYRNSVGGLRWKSPLCIWGGALWLLAGVWQVLARVSLTR